MQIWQREIKTSRLAETIELTNFGCVQVYHPDINRNTLYSFVINVDTDNTQLIESVGETTTE